MTRESNMLLKIEIIWWVITIILMGVIIYPILSSTSQYPFLIYNCIYIIAAVQLVRYIFLLKYTYLAHKNILKVVIILIIIPILFYMISGLNYFQTYIDENGMSSLFEGSSMAAYTQMGNFIRNQYFLFGITAIVGGVFLPFRLILSLWRWKNTGEV